MKIEARIVVIAALAVSGFGVIAGGANASPAGDASAYSVDVKPNQTPAPARSLCPHERTHHFASRADHHLARARQDPRQARRGGSAIALITPGSGER